MVVFAAFLSGFLLGALTCRWLIILGFKRFNAKGLMRASEINDGYVVTLEVPK